MAKNHGAVRILLDAGANVNALDNRGWTPLIYAFTPWQGMTASQTIELPKLLLDAGAESDVRDPTGKTPLMIATYIARGQLTPPQFPEVLRFLLDEGQDLEARDSDGMTALMHAAKSASGPVVLEALLDAGANPMMFVRKPQLDYPDGMNAWDFVQENMSMRSERATAHAHLDRARDRRGFAVPPGRWRSPDAFWLNAVYTENLLREPQLYTTPELPLQLESLRSLHKAGVYFDARNSNRETALIWAARHNDHPEALQFLIDAGADLELMDIFGLTPLLAAAKHSDNPAIVHLLLDAGANVVVFRKAAWDLIQGNDALKSTSAYERLNDLRSQ